MQRLSKANIAAGIADRISSLRPTLLSLILVTLLAHCQSSLDGAQQSKPTEELKWHFGCELFQMLLEERGMATMQSLESSLRSPTNSVIALTGDFRRLSSDTWSRLHQFVNQGGNVLLASDLPRSMTGIGKIHAGPVAATLVENRYLDFRDCIRIRDIDTAHPVMLGVDEIVSNRTSWLSLPSKATARTLRWQVIASLPSHCLPQESSNQPLVAVGHGNTQVSGVIVVIADTSVLTNGMIWHGNNSTFVIRISELLGGDKKTSLTFISDGQVLSSSKERLPSPEPEFPSNTSSEQLRPKVQDLSSTDLETTLRVANHVLRSVADSNILNEVLVNQPRQVNAKSYQLGILTFLAGSGIVLFLAYLLRRVAARGKRLQIPPPLSAFQMDAALKQVNSQYGPPAFILAREFCKECSAPSSEKEWKTTATRFCYSKAIPDDKSFREKLEYVRSFEISNLVPMVTEKEFLRLGKTIQELRAAIRSPRND